MEIKNRRGWVYHIAYRVILLEQLAFTTSGLADYLGAKLSALSILPFPVVVILIVSITMIIGNTMSNTATAAIFIPVVASMAALNHWPPLPFLAGDYII
jgi:sodium-dependent dicarboxylate transporter 2/3/5